MTVARNERKALIAATGYASRIADGAFGVWGIRMYILILFFLILWRLEGFSIPKRLRKE
jgi:hypothetical protein